MSASLLTKQRQFDDLCQQMRDAGLVTFDTEFVSESTYRPRLSLLQFSVNDKAVAVDPFQVDDLSAWWEIMADDKTTIIAHGSREEIRFCVTLGHCKPQRMVDVQIAEGLLSRGYPVGHSQLLQRVLNVRVGGKQTRTDWERRPLSNDQLRYALEDVEHLGNVWKTQQAALEELGRLSWAEAEFDRYTRMISDEPLNGNWKRISGWARLSRREMGVLREIHGWRERAAQQLDKPARWVLRDDLVIEISKLHPTSRGELTQMRGMQRRDYLKHSDDILDAVERALDLPEADLPAKVEKRRNRPDVEPMTRLLAMALANRCSELSISMSLVGTTTDLEALIHWHIFDKRKSATPKLMDGWREEVCGDLLIDLLDGRISLRVVDPVSDTPLRFETVDGDRVNMGAKKKPKK